MMLWVGLTGGIATGKSAAAQILTEMGYAVVDADSLAREVVQKGSETLAKIIETFGQEYLREDGTLDRSRMGQLVFSDPRRRQTLEDIIHPAIQVLTRKRKLELEARGENLAFYDVPLLFEKDLQNQFDSTVLIYVPHDLQLKRLMSRDQLTQDEAQQRIDAQTDIEDKKKLADYVIDNSTDIPHLKAQLAHLVDLLQNQG